MVVDLRSYVFDRLWRLAPRHAEYQVCSLLERYGIEEEDPAVAREQAEEPSNQLVSVYRAFKVRTEALGYIYIWANQ